MKRQHPGVYFELKEKVKIARKRKSNLLVYTFAGSGTTHYLKELGRLDKQLTYINTNNQKLGDFNLLDLPLNEAITYVNQVSIIQKYLLVVQSGSDFHSSTIKNLNSHLYIKFPLKAGSVSDIKDMIHRFGYKDSINLSKIMDLSGGIPKLAKYLIVNEGKVDENDSTYQILIKDISNSILGYSPQELESLSIIDSNGKYLSKLLEIHLNKVLDLNVNFDLSFKERGILSTKKFTSLEAKVVQRILENGGNISKEEVSDIKWGVGKYDQFSDQAINKTMRRLNSKLNRFQIETIPKVGFKLISK